jgi:hypothetical protein
MKTLNEVLKHNYSNDFNYLANHYKFDKSHHDDFKGYVEGSKTVNASLWNSRNNDHNLIGDETNSRIKNLDSALSLHKTPQDMTVYSGSIHDPRKMKNSEGIVHHPAYLSTSLNKNVAQRFSTLNQTYDVDADKPAKHLYKIKVPQGSSGAFIAHHSHLPGENEFILPRGTNLKHEKTESRETPTKIFHTHHMSVVK